jgi:putative membrane protein
MPQRLYRSFQALLLLALCIYLAVKAASGQLTFYINLRFVPFTIAGTIFLAILAQTLFTEMRRARQHATEHGDDHDDHDHKPDSANLWFMLIPLAIGILIPTRALDSSAFATKGFNTTGPLVSSNSTAQLLGTESLDRNVLDWIKIFNYEKDITPYLGQQASVIGFVYRDDQLKENQFYVSRFVIACCAADGFAIAMVADSPQAQTYEKDSWVLVKGTISSMTLNDHPVPVIQADSIQSVPVPEQPYLFP